MSENNDPLMTEIMGQATFGFEKDGDYSLKVLGETPEGHTLFKRMEAHGGYSYWSDEVAPAVLVYDEELGNVITLFAALNDLKVGELLWRHIGEVYGYTPME